MAGNSIVLPEAGLERVPILTLFNPRARVGKSLLTWNVAAGLGGLGQRVFLVDADPQATLSSLILDRRTLASLWSDGRPGETLSQCIAREADSVPLVRPRPLQVSDRLFLLPGDPQFGQMEAAFARAWAHPSRSAQAIQMLHALWRVLVHGALETEADLVLVDAPSGWGALSRSIYLSADFAAIPATPDPLSTFTLETLHQGLSGWKDEWSTHRSRWAGGTPVSEKVYDPLPPGDPETLGYILNHGCPLPGEDRLDTRNETEAVAAAFHRSFPPLDRVHPNLPESRWDECWFVPHPSLPEDPACLGVIRPYMSILALALEARKPLFHLSVRDGAIGSLAGAVNDAGWAYETLSHRLGVAIGLKTWPFEGPFRPTRAAPQGGAFRKYPPDLE